MEEREKSLFDAALIYGDIAFHLTLRAVVDE
jgi:hypothetical protein